MYLHGLLNVTFIVVAIHPKFYWTFFIFKSKKTKKGLKKVRGVLNEEVSQLRIQTPSAPSVGRHFLFINRPAHQRYSTLTI